jgi:hypothetical protein
MNLNTNITSIQNISPPIAPQEEVSCIDWCRIETGKLFSQLPKENSCLEVARRIAILLTVIIPLIGLIASCCHTTKEKVKVEPINSSSLSATTTHPIRQENSKNKPTPITYKQQPNTPAETNALSQPPTDNQQTPVEQPKSAKQTIASTQEADPNPVVQFDPVLNEINEKIRTEMPIFWNFITNPSEPPIEETGTTNYLNIITNEFKIEIPSDLVLKQDLHTTKRRYVLENISVKQLFEILNAKIPTLTQYISLDAPDEAMEKPTRFFGYVISKGLIAPPGAEDPHSRCLAILYKNQNGESLFSLRPGLCRVSTWHLPDSNGYLRNNLVKTENEVGGITHKIPIYVSSKVPELPTTEQVALENWIPTLKESNAITSMASLLAFILPAD